MWSKYKFYIIAFLALTVVGIVIYKKKQKEEKAISGEVKTKDGQAESGTSTVNPSSAPLTALNSMTGNQSENFSIGKAIALAQSN